MAAFDGDYVFSAALTAEIKDEIKKRSEAQLAQMLGVDADMETMAEFIGVMIGNKKSMAQVAHELGQFIGDEHAQEFVAWLSGMLPTLEGPTANGDAGADDDADSLAPPSSTGDNAEQPKRVISLKSVTSSEPAPQKKVISLTGGSSTVRSLTSDSKDMSAVLARRSQRFGIPEKPATTQQPKNNKSDKDNNRDGRSAKRKADADDAQQKRPGSGGSGRLAQLLGPPVNVDQAELDARDSLQSNKRKKTGRGEERDNRGARNEQENERNSDGNGRRQNRRRQDNDSKDDTQPPLPPGSPRDRDRNGRSDRGGRNDRDGRDSRDGRNGRDGRDASGGRGDPRDFHQGGFRGPPGYGGFAPPPYGHPMGYFPPPYGMPPYGMGFPPQGMPPGPYMPPPMPPGPPKQHYQPRGAPRPFQNKKWVNPNTVKAEGETPAEGASEEDGASGAAAAGAPAMSQNAQPYIPRNPYYNAQMRPRFQNKTWVRADPAKEEELSSSLPQTPPREEAEAAQ